MLDCHPMRPRQIRGRKHTFGFQQFSISFRPGGKREYRPLVIVKVHQGKHLAANRLVPHPEDQVCTPLHGFDHVGQAQQVFP